MNKSVLVTICLAIAALALWGGVYAQKSTYRSFETGKHLDAVVSQIGQKTIAVSFDDESGVHRSSIYSEPLSEKVISSFKVGDRIRIAHPVGNPMRIMPESAIEELQASASYLRTVKSVSLACALSFIWTIVQSMRRKRLRTGWDVILWSLARTRRVFLAIGLLLMSFGVFVAWLTWHDSQQDAPPAIWQQAMLYLLALASGFFGIFGFFRGLGMLNMKKSPLYEKLTTRASEIVWIYEMNASTRHIESSKEFYVMVGFLDGSLDQIAVEKDHASLVMQTLAQKAPQARIGYTKELSTVFQQNPSAVQSSVQR